MKRIVLLFVFALVFSCGKDEEVATVDPIVGVWFNAGTIYELEDGREYFYGPSDSECNLMSPHIFTEDFKYRHNEHQKEYDGPSKEYVGDCLPYSAELEYGYWEKLAVNKYRVVRKYKNQKEDSAIWDPDIITENSIIAIRKEEGIIREKDSIDSPTYKGSKYIGFTNTMVRSDDPMKFLSEL